MRRGPTPRAPPTVLIAGPGPRVEELARAVGPLGVRVVRAPVVAVLPLTDTSALDRALRQRPSYDWAVFTSARGVEAVGDRCRALGLIPGGLARRIAAVGPGTARAAFEAGFGSAAMPRRFVTSALPEVLGRVEGLRVLLARADLATRELRDALVERGAHVTSVDAYRTEPAQAGAVGAADAADFALFTSASGVRFLAGWAGRERLEALAGRAQALCIGPVTAKAASEAGFRVVKAADPHTQAGLISLLATEVAARG
jgi:uroporphyrinogen-III synthase